MPETGRTIGRYVVLRGLGEGGMAVVHLARQQDLQRFVALKELRALRGDDPSYAQRFLREARLAGSLADPHVVTVYEYLEHEGTPFLAMEYLERGSLRPYVGRLNFAQVSGVLEAVLAGLVSAERAGIVHRDLKPENVLVAADGRVKIADFGIAKATSAVNAGTFKTSTGMMIGTPAYMAPEQAMAGDVGPWTDLYSVGCLAFELFTGERPFADVDAPMALLMRHATEPVPPVSTIVPDIDPRISEWIAALLVKDAAARTQSAAAAWDDYEEIALTILGPRWRRQARLLEPGEPTGVTTDEAPAATAKPYTPPPPDLPPAPLAPPPGPTEPGEWSPATPPPAATPAPSEPTPSGPAMSPPAPAVSPPATAPTPSEPAVSPPATAPTPSEPAVSPLATAPPAPAPSSPPADGRRSRVPMIAAAVVLVAVVVGAIVLFTRDAGQAEDDATVTTVVGTDGLIKNASFETDTAGWEPFQATLTREEANDAPDGEFVVRVTAQSADEQYAIDDEPDTVESGSVDGDLYTASAWVKATATSDGQPICIAIREWSPGRTDSSFTAIAQGSVTASAGEWRRVTARYAATAGDNTISVHVFRYPGQVVDGDAFLVDAITLNESDDPVTDDQLVERPTCGA